MRVIYDMCVKKYGKWQKIGYIQADGDKIKYRLYMNKIDKLRDLHAETDGFGMVFVTKKGAIKHDDHTEEQEG